MSGIIKKKLVLTLIILLLGFFSATSVNAASLSNVSDTITTSRPSASAPLVGNQAAGAGQVTINDNGSIFLASDSAVLWPDTGETLNTVNVASMSAANTPSANQRIVYFTNTAANTHHAGDPITTAITATHKIQFTTISTIPASGKIVITLPGTAVTTASPSASTFSFNGLTSANAASNISYKLDGTRTCTFAVATAGSSPTITCTIDSGGSIAGGTTITFLIGCADASSNATSCTASSPRLINPTKTAAAGTADTWKISIKTQDTSLVDLDTGSAKIGTIDAVQVQGTVEPTLTFSIAGIANGTTISTNNSACTGNTDVTNSGLATSATFVNLGVLANGVINIAAQDLTVSTNGSSGYSITATSSGRFINPASGFWISDANGGNGLTANDTPAPAVFPASGNPAFGIHPCGTRVSTGTWAASTTSFSAGNKYSNPWNSGTNAFYATITSYTGGAVSNEKTTVEYASTVSGTTPPGIYSNYFTYVATATF